MEAGGGRSRRLRHMAHVQPECDRALLCLCLLLLRPPPPCPPGPLARSQLHSRISRHRSHLLPQCIRLIVQIDKRQDKTQIAPQATDTRDRGTLAHEVHAGGVRGFGVSSSSRGKK